jgi:hypothetical protein
MEGQSQCQLVEFNALTCIDTASNLVELICIDNKTAEHICDNIGYVGILVLYDVHMTREVNLLDKTFNGYWQSLASRMFAQPAKIPNIL